jgi:hypothetical protein
MRRTKRKIGNKTSSKLTLDRQATYQIKVPGVLNPRRVNINIEVSVAIGNDRDGLPITILTVIVDQAGLHGLLRHLYALGLPLISVICFELA